LDLSKRDAFLRKLFCVKSRWIMLPPVRRPLKPNWWTIVPVLASVALWGGIVYTGSALNDRDEAVAVASRD